MRASKDLNTCGIAYGLQLISALFRIVWIADYVNLNTLPEDIKCWVLERYRD